MFDFIDPSKFNLAFIGCAAILIVIADWLCFTKTRMNAFLGIYGVVGISLLVISLYINVPGGGQALIGYLIIGGLYSKARLAVINKTDERKPGAEKN